MVLAPPPGFQPAVLAAALSRLAHQQKTAPLTCWTAWHSPQTSQRAVVQAVAVYRTVIVGGGQRTGKTASILAVDVALARGSDDPHARMFWTRHGVDPDLFPKGPGEGAITALTSSLSMKNHRRQVERLFPPGTYRFVNRDGKGEAYIEFFVPGYELPGRIYFMSEEQGEEAFQSAKWRFSHHDEEGPTSAIWAEAGARLTDLDGWQIMTNTPIHGKTWVYHQFVKEPPAGVGVVNLYTEDNPFLPRNAVERLTARGNPDMRLRGAWENVEGLVYPEWDRRSHVVGRARWSERYPDIPWPEGGWPTLPAEWPRFRAMDFGASNPCVVLWFAVDTHGRRVYYREAYHQGRPIADWWAPLILRAEADPRGKDGPSAWTGCPPDRAATRGWADPAGAQEIRDLRARGVYFAKANKALTAGISRVREGLAAEHVWVLEGACPKLVSEVEAYRWPDDKGTTTAIREVPVKRDDHAVDCLRYGEVGARRYLRLWSAEPDEGGEEE
jgi:hypothetical protein